MPQDSRIRPFSCALVATFLVRSGVGLVGLPVLHQLERDHGAEAAHVADAGEAVLLGERVEPVHQPLAELLGALEQLLLRRSRRARRRRPRRRSGCRHRCRRGRRAARESITSARPMTAESGKPPARLFAVVMISGATPLCSIANILPVRAMPDCTSSETSMILCSSQILRSACRKSLRRDIEAAFALHRLDHDAGDARRIDVGLEQRLQCLQRILDRHAMQRVRERARDRPRPRRGRRPCRAAPCRSSPWSGWCGRGRRRRRRSTARAVGVVARDLHRVLQRLGAGREEDRLLREVAGCQLVQPLGQLDVGLIGHDLERRVRELLASASSTAAITFG